jgi:hypothetical protein
MSRDPSLLIVIDSKTRELEDAVKALRLETDTVVFQTFVHGDSLTDHLHEFQPLFGEETTSISPVPETDTSDLKRGNITFSLGGKRVTLSRDDILKASRDPRIKNYFFIGYYVSIDGKKLPVKGLLSLATGIPVTEFASTPRARGILQKLGFTIVHSEQGSMRVEGQHLKQPDFEQEILRILSTEQRPLARKDIITKLYERMHAMFSDADEHQSRVEDKDGKRTLNGL